VRLPAASASTTNASQPAIALPRWRVLQRPMRAAAEGEELAEEGVMAAASPRRRAPAMRATGVWWWGMPHP
jgi:hypothetical protein